MLRKIGSKLAARAAKIAQKEEPAEEVPRRGGFGKAFRAVGPKIAGIARAAQKEEPAEEAPLRDSFGKAFREVGPKIAARVAKAAQKERPAGMKKGGVADKFGRAMKRKTADAKGRAMKKGK